MSAHNPSGTAYDVDLAIRGMTCASCVGRVEKALNGLEGVSATVNLPLESARVRVPAGFEVERLVEAVAGAGYEATLPAPEPTHDAHGGHGGHDHDAMIADLGLADPETALRQRLLVSAVLSVPVVLMAMVPAVQFDNWQWASLTLAAPVVVWGAWPFHRAAWTNAKHGVATMDTLVSVGVLAAFAWSLVALFFGHAGMVGMRHGFSLMPERTDGLDAIYLEAAAGVTTLILAGKFAEVRSKRKAGAALRALLELGAKDAVVLDADGQETVVPIADVVVGTVFVARPGDKVATDGVIVEGTSAIDNALLTGESVPVDLGPGDAVVGGAVVVSGRLLVRATAIGADTQVAHMARLVSDAQTGKAAVQRLADRVSAVFVPVVIVLAALTALGWGLLGESWTVAFAAAVAVLIVACPCALGLATPIGLLVGTGRGAQLGIVVKGPEVLESTRVVDTIVLDKTGTVTTGVMEVVGVQAARGVEEPEVLRMAAAVEAGSEHPIGRAILRAATGVPVASDFVSTAGVGVEATIDGERVSVSRSAAAGDQTAVDVVWGGRWKGTITLADTVKETSAQAVVQLKALGLRPILLTGDARGPALSAAAAVGIDQADVIAEVLPTAKVDVVRRLQDEGRVVAMVGDGVNDAAALATADLGIAMGTGTEVAIEASDLTIVGGDLVKAADAIRLSRRTLAVIKGNLFWAFAYNVAAIPLAMAALLQPMIAGAAMAFSSVFVIGNSLRLRRFR